MPSQDSVSSAWERCVCLLLLSERRLLTNELLDQGRISVNRMVGRPPSAVDCEAS